MGQASLASLFVDALVSEAQRFLTVPVLSPRLEDTGAWYRERMSRDSCGLGMRIQPINLSVFFLECYFP